MFNDVVYRNDNIKSLIKPTMSSHHNKDQMANKVLTSDKQQHHRNLNSKWRASLSELRKEFLKTSVLPWSLNAVSNTNINSH